MKKSFQSAQNHISSQRLVGHEKNEIESNHFFYVGVLRFQSLYHFITIGRYSADLTRFSHSCYPYECNLRLYTKLVSGCFVLFQSIVVLLNYWGIKWLLLLPNKCRANMNEFESDWYCCQKNLIWLAQWIYPEKFKRCKCNFFLFIHCPNQVYFTLFLFFYIFNVNLILFWIVTKPIFHLCNELNLPM